MIVAPPPPPDPVGFEVEAEVMVEFDPDVEVAVVTQLPPDGEAVALYVKLAIIPTRQQFCWET